MCYHAEFGRSALKSVCINTGEPPNWGALELRSLGMEGVALLLNVNYDEYYRVMLNELN